MNELQILKFIEECVLFADANVRTVQFDDGASIYDNFDTAYQYIKSQMCKATEAGAE